MATARPARPLTIGLLHIQSAFIMLRAGYSTEVWRLARRRLYSDSRFLLLRCDLALPNESPSGILPLTLRQIRKSDVPALLDLEEPGITATGVSDRVHQWRLLEAGLKTCYVAVTVDDCPCFMAWLVGPCENARVEAYFKGGVALLRGDEMMIEGVFTLEKYRGRRVMQSACAKLREIAAVSAARWIVAYVDENNGPSLTAFSRMGYVPYLLRHERWRFGLRRVAFLPVPAEAGTRLDHHSRLPAHSAS
jgi:hypothetical protein